MGDDRQAQTVGDGRPEDGPVGVARLLAEEDEVRAFALEGGGEDAAGGDQVGAFGRLVGDEHGAIGAHRKRAAERFESPSQARA